MYTSASFYFFYPHEGRYFLRIFFRCGHVCGFASSHAAVSMAFYVYHTEQDGAIAPQHQCCMCFNSTHETLYQGCDVHMQSDIT